MGLFGKKVDSDSIQVMHYEGLRGFAQDSVCTIHSQDDILISRMNPEIDVTLPRKQITAIDIMPEKNFMAKYHGHADTTAKFAAKMYVVINYVSSDGADSHIAFWYPNTDLKTGNKIRALKTDIEPAPSSYTL